MDQAQQQAQIQLVPSNLIKSSHVILTRLDSTSNAMLDESIHGEQIHLPASLLPNRSTSLRSVLKTSGLFNKDMESSDKLNELFANGNEFTLHRLLSDIVVNDVNIDMNELVKFDPMKLLDTRSLSEFLQCDSFDQINTSSHIPSNSLESIPPSAIACSSQSFSELSPLTPELSTNEVFLTEINSMKMEPENSLIYTQLNSFENFVFTPSVSTPAGEEFSFDPSTLAAFERDYNYLSKRTTVVDTPSPSPTVSKRTATRSARRTSSRLQTRAALFDVKQLFDDDLCLSPTASENSSVSSRRVKHSRPVNRATDIQTEDDLSYYLERRRKNNEASKMSRAARKQKYGDMDSQCADYERANEELRAKLAVLEMVTVNLKSGLIHTFQRKSSGELKF